MKQLMKKIGEISAIIFTALAILYPCYASAAIASSPCFPESLKVSVNRKLAIERKVSAFKYIIIFISHGRKLRRNTWMKLLKSEGR